MDFLRVNLGTGMGIEEDMEAFAKGLGFRTACETQDVMSAYQGSHHLPASAKAPSFWPRAILRSGTTGVSFLCH